MPKLNNYKTGALKRKLGVSVRGKTEPGALITNMNTQKAAKNKKAFGTAPNAKKVAIMGLV